MNESLDSKISLEPIIDHFSNQTYILTSKPTAFHHPELEVQIVC